MVERNTAPVEGTPRTWFVVLITYYVFAIYLVPSSAKVERFSPTYFALIVPAWLYIAVNWRNLLSGYVTASKLLALFAVMAGFSGVLRGDYSLAYNVVFLAAMAIILLNSRVYLTVVELNWLFLGCIFGSIAIYALDATAYGFLPGQAEGESCHASMRWRISLFRVTAESAMFSLIILIANITYGHRLPAWVRGLVIFVAAYFLIFSGIRSIVAAALIVCPAIAVIAFRRASPKGRRQAAVGSLAGAVLILSVPYWLEADAGFWKNYALRTQTCSYLTYYYGPSGVPSVTTDHFDGPAADRSIELAAAGGIPAVDRSIELAAAGGIPAADRSIELAAAGGIPADWYRWTVNRQCGAIYQLSLFASAPLGSKDVQPSSDQQLTALGCATDQLRYYCASCSFATYWLARAGVSAIPLILSFVALLAGAIHSRMFVLAWTMLAFGLVSFGWGVMYVPYNAIFLLMVAMTGISSFHEN